MSNNNNTSNNFWASSAENDVRSSGVYNPYTPNQGGRGSARGNYPGYSGAGRGDGGRWRPNRIENPHPNKPDPESFQQETIEILNKIIKADPKTTLSTLDFGNVRCLRENFRAVLYTAVEKGLQEYKSSNRMDLASRWQFTSVDKLLELINDPNKMSSEVIKLNLTHGSPPTLNERTKLYDFPDILGDDILCGIGSTEDAVQRRIYYLTGIRRIIARNLGATQQTEDFYNQYILPMPDTKLMEFYTKHGKFIEFVWTSPACLPWNPAQIPKVNILKKSNNKKNGPSNQPLVKTPVIEEDENKQPTNNEADPSQALHNPNSIVKIEPAKLLMMNSEACAKYIKEKLRPYITQYYGAQPRLLRAMDGMKQEELAKLLFTEGECERFAKEHDIIPTTARKQNASDRDKLIVHPFDTSYVIQCSKRNCKGVSAATVLTDVYGALHPILNSLGRCHLGLEPMHEVIESKTIYEPDMVENMVDESYISNITKENYKDTLQFQFRINTKADVVNMLSRVRDFNVSENKTLATFLKDQAIQLFIIWKAPPGFKEIAMIVGPTKYTDTIRAADETANWLFEFHAQTFDPNQFRFKWRRRNTKNMTMPMLVLSADPSIYDTVKKHLTDRSELDPTSYPETYDYDFYPPNDEDDDPSYILGIGLQNELISKTKCAEIKGITHDLYIHFPNEADSRWADAPEDQTICDRLISKDEILYKKDDELVDSPFTKLYRTGNGWYLAWRIGDNDSAKYYLDNQFRKDMYQWTKKDYSSITIRYLFDDNDDDAMTQSASITEADEQEEVNEEAVQTDEFGRYIREPKSNKVSNTATTASTSGMNLNSREMKSNASSSLTTSTQYHHGTSDSQHPGRNIQVLPVYSDSNQHSIRIPNHGELMNTQQVNQLLQTVEQQALQVISNHITTAMSFHDPNTGIKNMIIEQLNLYHESMKREIATISRPRTVEQSANISRTKSMNDIHLPEARSIPRIFTNACNSEQEKPEVIIAAPKQEREEGRKIQGSFAPNFNPPPENVQKHAIEYSSQISAEAATTPIAEIINPPPDSYRGPIRDIGDGIIKSLDAVLENATADNPPNNANQSQIDTALNAADVPPDSENSDDDTDDLTSKEDKAQQVSTELKAKRRSTRKAPSSESNQQTHPETTTGDPTMKPSKAARKKS